MTKTTIRNASITLMLLLNSFAIIADEKVVSPVAKAEKDALYKNKTYHFSFRIPTGWEKQSGNVNADNVLFMQMPINNSCGFQFNVAPMSESFPAEAAVNTALASAYHELRLNKLAAVKRRDTSLKEKVKEKGKTREKTLILTRGWVIMEKPQKQKQQRIIYQAYDRENRYFNFIAFATSEKFPACAVELQKIIDSIEFSTL